MNTLAIETSKNYTKLLLYSVYALVFSFMITPGYSFFSNTLFAVEIPAIQGGVVKTDFIDKAAEEAYKKSLFVSEQKRWDESVKKRYRNGAILTVAPGVKHIKLTKYTSGGAVKVNVVEVNKKLNPNIEIEPVLAADTLSNKATIRTMAKKNNAIAAINAGFFKPQNGIPLGTLMIDKKLVTGPIYDRVAMGIKEDGFVMDRMKLNAELSYKKHKIAVDNINQPRMLSSYVIAYTRDWGQTAPPPPKYGVAISVEDGKITKISNGSITIPHQGFTIIGPKQKLEPFFNAQMADERETFLANLTHNGKIELKIKTEPDWDDVNHIVSGGPYLVRNGGVYVDTAEQKLNSIAGRNPRTAVGYTKNDELVMITIDGREKASVGMTLLETARLMKEFGCEWAMNLDGGGSSVMYVKNNIVNTPCIKGGIALSNALVVKES